MICLSDFFRGSGHNAENINAKNCLVERGEAESIPFLSHISMPSLGDRGRPGEAWGVANPMSCSACEYSKKKLASGSRFTNPKTQISLL